MIMKERIPLLKGHFFLVSNLKCFLSDGKVSFIEPSVFYSVEIKTNETREKGSKLDSGGYISVVR